MTLTAESRGDNVFLTKVTESGEVFKTRTDRGVYDVLGSIGKLPMRNKDVQYLLKERLGCSDGRAAAIIERFTPGYKGFCGIALLQASLGGDSGRERMFTSAENGQAEKTLMITRRLGS